jgi:tetratricopeptide (TPR) repeat protein
MAAQPAAQLVPELREALLSQFTSQLYKVRGHEEVVRVLTSPLAKTAMTASLHLALGLSLFELKNYSAAAQQMHDCLAKKNQPALTPINVDILTAAPWHCLALCQLRTSDAAGAEKSFVQAVAANGRANEARVDFAKFLAEQNRAVEALQQLHAAVTDDSQCALAWRLGGQITLAQKEFLDFALDWTAEAMRNLPEDLLVKSQRAEALLVAGKISEAAPLWQNLWERDRLPRSLAALHVCALAGGKTLPVPGSAAEEEQLSRAFIGWYQRLLGAGAMKTAHELNENLPVLAAALPTAEKILRAAMAEAVGAATA